MWALGRRGRVLAEPAAPSPGRSGTHRSPGAWWRSNDWACRVRGRPTRNDIAQRWLGGICGHKKKMGGMSRVKRMVHGSISVIWSPCLLWPVSPASRAFINALSRAAISHFDLHIATPLGRAKVVQRCPDWRSLPVPLQFCSAQGSPSGGLQ